MGKILEALCREIDEKIARRKAIDQDLLEKGKERNKNYVGPVGAEAFRRHFSRKKMRKLTEEAKNSS